MTIALCWESLCARAGSPTLPGTPTCRAACGNTTVSRVDRAEAPQTRVDRAVNHLWLSVAVDAGHSIQGGRWSGQIIRSASTALSTLNRRWLSLHSTLTVQSGSGHYIQVSGGQVATRQVISDLL